VRGAWPSIEDRPFPISTIKKQVAAEAGIIPFSCQNSSALVLIFPFGGLEELALFLGRLALPGRKLVERSLVHPELLGEHGVSEVLFLGRRVHILGDPRGKLLVRKGVRRRVQESAPLGEVFAATAGSTRRGRGATSRGRYGGGLLGHHVRGRNLDGRRSGRCRLGRDAVEEASARLAAVREVLVVPGGEKLGEHEGLVAAHHLHDGAILVAAVVAAHDVLGRYPNGFFLLLEGSAGPNPEVNGGAAVQHVHVVVEHVLLEKYGKKRKKEEDIRELLVKHQT